MRLIEQLEILSADRKAAAAETYRQILFRNGDPQAADAQILADGILPVLGLTLADVKADAEALARYGALKDGTASTPPAAWQRLKAAADLMAGHPRLWSAEEAQAIRPTCMEPQSRAVAVYDYRAETASLQVPSPGFSPKLLAHGGTVRRVTESQYTAASPLFGLPARCFLTLAEPLKDEPAIGSNVTVYEGNETLMSKIL